jgi:hypothetical protein
MVPSLRTVNGTYDRSRSKITHPNTPTAQTSVLSPRALSVAILSLILPDVMSQILRLLSEHPATIHGSDQSREISSSSSSSLLDSSSLAFARATLVHGVGGPQAILKSRHLALSNRRWSVSVSCNNDTSRTEPSSQPSASRVEAGLTAMDQIEPAWEPKTRCGCAVQQQGPYITT